jgi:hypothetical protein
MHSIVWFNAIIHAFEAGLNAVDTGAPSDVCGGEGTQ